MEQEKMNQTSVNEANEAKATNPQSEANADIASIRQKIEERYNNKLNKAQIEFTAQLEAANKELDFYKNQLPQIQKAYSANGGNGEYFNDWLAINKDKLNYEDIDKSVKESFEATKWAKSSGTFNVSETLNRQANTGQIFNDDDFEPGTVYKKMK